MLGKIGGYLRHHHVALAALFFALGGASFAAGGKLLPKNSVGTKQVVDHSLLARDFKKGQLPAGARGARGERGATGARGATGSQGPATGPAGGDLAGSYPNPTLKSQESWIAVSSGSFQDCLATGGPPPKWQNYSSPPAVSQAAYFRDRFGIVHVQGVVSCPGGAFDALTIWTMPAGYRPAEGLRVAAVLSDGSTMVLQFDPAGNVFPRFSATTTWLSLDGISYRCGPSGSNGCP